MHTQADSRDHSAPDGLIVADTNTAEPERPFAPRLRELANSLVSAVQSNNEPIVVAIKGGWGEGKTHFWKKTVLPEIAEKRPGYVSVFGAETLAQIQREVLLEAAKASSDADRKLQQRITEKFPFFKKVNVGRGIARIFDSSNVPLTFFLDLMENFVFPDDWILCLDDIERLSKSIELDALFGYINALRDERKVNVVLIYNEEKVGGQDSLEALKRYSEKVVDRELAFAPNIDEIVELVCSNRCNDRELEVIKKCCRSIELRNIRILKRILQFRDELKKALPENADQELLLNTLPSIVLFAWIKYASLDARTLTFDYLRLYQGSITDFTNENEDEVDERHERLKDYGYLFTDDFDLILIKWISSGLLDEPALKEVYGTKATDSERERLRNELTNVWQEHYHNTLRDTEVEFVDALTQATRNFFEYIGASNLDESLHILQQLGHEGHALALLDEFLQKRPNAFDSYRPSDLSGPIKFEPLKSALDEAYERSSSDQRVLADLIDDIRKDEFIRSDDMAKLSEYSAAELVSFFTKSNLQHLTSTMRRIANNSSRKSNVDEEKVHRAIREAAEVIAKQSPMNRLRMQSMGLIDSEQSKEDDSRNDKGESEE